MMRLPKKTKRNHARTQKSVHDTAAGCRGLAAADLARAALMDMPNRRRQLEISAQSWTSRAQLIEREEASFQARHAVAKAA